MSQKKVKVPVKEWINQYKKNFKEWNTYFVQNDWSDAPTIEKAQEEFDAQITLIETILDRLEVFFKKFRTFYKLKYVREFVDIMTSSVYLHLERTFNYSNSNSWMTEVDKDRKKKMIAFQGLVVKKGGKIKDKLEKINIDDEVITVDIPIHSDKKIPLLMADLIENKYPEISVIKNNTIADMEVVKAASDVNVLSSMGSPEMHINVKNPPEYDLKKHYFEQTPDVLQYYKEEERKLREGVTINGVFFHPWLYWHINFFKTDLPMVMMKHHKDYNSKKKKIITQPPLRDNEYFMIECYKEAEQANKGLFAFGTRRYAKTTMEASLISWKTSMVENSESMVIGGDVGDLDKLSKTIEIAFTNVHPAFQLTRNKSDWSKHVQFGLKDKTTKIIPYSDVFIRNVSGGKEHASEKTAGATPTCWIVDEAGKFQCKQMYHSAIPSFETPEGLSLVPLLVGTGGNPVLSSDAQEMLLNPEVNGLLAMNWDRLENMVKEKDLITWERKSFGIFLPAQMSYKTGLTKVDTNMSEFLGVKGKGLEKVDIKVTDWAGSKKKIEEQRELLKKDREAAKKDKMSYPLDTRECFLSSTKNPFPAMEAAMHRDKLIETGDVGRPVQIYIQEKDSTQLSFADSDAEQPDYPHKGGNIESPPIIYNEPPEDNVMDGTYVAGLDHYKLEKADTDSVGSLYIMKRNVNIDKWSDRIVASYCSRPSSMKNFNRTCEMLLEGYGAECLQENIDISFQQYLNDKNKAELLLAKGEELAQARINSKATQNNKFGLNANPKNKQYLLKLVQTYCNEDLLVGTDENGIDITVKGVTRIPDIHLLQEIIQFDYDGNYDRITAFGHALAWSRYLDYLGIMPKVKVDKTSNTYRKQQRIQKMKYSSVYSDRRHNPYTA